MPKEKSEYRDNLEDLHSYFGEKRLLTIKDVAEYCGRSREFVTRLYGLTKEGITTATLARRMCQ